MPYKNPWQQAEYQRQYIANRRAEWIAEHGPCAVCASWHDLEVDHIDPKTKKIRVCSIWTMSPTNPKRIAELAKCQVLCHWHHVDKTWNQEGRPRRQHGTASCYRNGCRLPECREAMRIQRREQRERRRAIAQG